MDLEHALLGLGFLGHDFFVGLDCRLLQRALGALRAPGGRSAGATASGPLRCGVCAPTGSASAVHKTAASAKDKDDRIDFTGDLDFGNLLECSAEVFDWYVNS